MQNVDETQSKSNRRMEWFRLWHDMSTDPKFRVIAKRSGRPITEVLSVFVLMLTNASANANERGELSNWSDEDAAAAFDIEPEHVNAIRCAMQGKLLDGEKITGWEKRQPKREDGSAERAKAWRERKRTQTNAPEKSRVEVEEEKNNNTSTVSLVAAREERPADCKEISDCKTAFNGSTEAMLAEVMAAMEPYPDRQKAAKWLATTLQVAGRDATAQAFQMLQTKRLENEPISRVLPWWSKTANSLKSKAPQPAEDKPKVKPVYREEPWMREAREALS